MQNNLNNTANNIYGMIVNFINNRLMLDIGSDSYLDLSLMENVPANFRKGDMITLSSHKISKCKAIPKLSLRNGELNLKEMDEHLGYAPYKRADSTNYRNGKKRKPIRSKYGEINIDVPQDRESTFEPKIVQKRQEDMRQII